MTLSRARTIACISATLTAHTTFALVARAQELRGTVRDSASNTPVAGAVVILLDAPGRSLARTLTNESGQYRLVLVPAVERLRVVHIGFRPRELTLPRVAPSQDTARLDITMVRLATLLEPVNVLARACGSRPDRASAIALLEQARTVLLATVVAQEANPGTVVAYGFQRRMKGTSDRIDYQTVRSDSLAGVSKSFVATRRGAAFVHDGFLGPSENGQDVLFAPDAETLLDEDFVNAYCFRLMQSERTRPHQLGLGFSPPDRKAGRVDIEGTLWVDTLSRTLQDIEFRYVGLDRRIQAFGPGGQISFRAMPNGVVLIDRWHLRLVGSRFEETVPGAERRIDPYPRLTFMVEEAGAELARARWPSGHEWQGSLGALRIDGVTAAGSPAIGARLRVPGTPYAAATDSGGSLEMRDLIPGPYDPVIVDPRLADVGLEIPTGVKVVAVRDSTIRMRLHIPTPEDYVLGRCDAQGRRGQGDATLILVRVFAPDGTPIQDAELSAYKPMGPGEASSLEWTPVRLGGTTASDGVFALCTDKIAVRQTLRLTVRHDGYSAVERIFQLMDPLTILRVELAPSAR
jgi:hypothetical protein